jgi:hypothetical protein
MSPKGIGIGKSATASTAEAQERATLVYCDPQDAASADRTARRQTSASEKQRVKADRLTPAFLCTGCVVPISSRLPSGSRR